MRRRQKMRSRKRRPPTIKDFRGLPARRIPVKQGGRQFESMMRTVRKKGVCTITERGKVTAVVLHAEYYWRLSLGRTLALLSAARRRNNNGIFTLADEVFESPDNANRWMMQSLPLLGGRRPLDMLATERGVQEVRDELTRIQHGIFA